MGDDHRPGGQLSRRTVLTGLGSAGLGLLTGCTAEPPAGGPPVVLGSGPRASSSPDLSRLFMDTGTCARTPATARGPYYFDAARMRGDIREDRAGTRLRLVLRVQDSPRCTPLTGAAVDIWHCDAAGRYSGAEAHSATGGREGRPRSPGPTGRISSAPGAAVTPSGAAAPGPAAPGPAAPGPAEPGPEPDLVPADDRRYLRGTQLTDDAGIVEFTTVWPGWHAGRTVHVHVLVRLAERRLLTTQVMFDDRLTQRVFAAAPYRDRLGRDTTNVNDPVFRPDLLARVSQDGDGWLALYTVVTGSAQVNSAPPAGTAGAPTASR